MYVYVLLNLLLKNIGQSAFPIIALEAFDLTFAFGLVSDLDSHSDSDFDFDLVDDVCLFIFVSRVRVIFRVAKE